MSEFQGWKSTSAGIFGTGDVALEKLRKPWPQDAPHNLVETSYFGFCVPEANINVEIYHWFHPMLGVASGGVFIFDAMHADTMGAQYMNYMNYQPMPDDITDCTYENGISIKAIELGQAFHITYADPKEDVKFDVVSRAIMPLAFRAAGGHFTQAMRNTGSLRLRGKDYAVDSWFSRDRSWGDPRSEARMDIPPIGWHVGVFSDDFAFHTTAFDSAERNPDLALRYPGFDAPRNHIWGYVWKGGELIGLRSTAKRTIRSDDGFLPLAIELELKDERGATYEVEGRIKSRFLLHPWPNTAAVFSLTEWRCGDLVGYGDTQECLYEPFIREHRAHLPSARVVEPA